MSTGPERVAVVGGGAAAAFLLHTLVELGGGDLEVVVFEPGERVGPGVAYGTADPVHLMNVCRTRLSADGDGGTDLVGWLEDLGIASNPDTYLRRSVYGDYLADVYARSAKQLSVSHRRARVVELVRHDGSWQVRLDDGAVEAFAHVVLVTGFPGRAALPCATPAGDARIVVDPWAPGALQRPDVRRVVVVGTGLTMVDVVLSLASANPDVELIAASRRGLVPRTSKPGLPVMIDPARLPVPGTSGRDLVRDLVRLGREEEAETGDWQAVVDTVRPRANELWRALSVADQARILRRWFPWWNVHRHRTAPAVGAGLAAARRREQLRIVRSRVAEVVADGRLTVRFADPAVADVEADLVVNATGPSDDLAASDDPLLWSLLDQGLAAIEPHGLGVRADPVGRVLSAGGGATPNLWVVGALRRGTEWETTAVPELRVQATEVVRRLLDPDVSDGDPLVQVGRC